MDRAGARWGAAAVVLLTNAGVAAVPAVVDARTRTCELLRVSVSGTSGDDVLVGTPRDDVIDARSGDDVVAGRGGNDTLCGGPGDDVLRGGEGIDHLAPGGGSDRVVGGRGGINVLSYVHAPSRIVADLASGKARGWGRDEIDGVHQIEGSRFADVLMGDARGNALVGLGGDDVVGGRAGDDSLIGGPGDDGLTGGRGSDYAVFIDSSGPVDVDLRSGTSAGDGNDVIQSIENVFGSRADDLLIGDRDDNEFVGGVDGDDTIRGGPGRDTVYRFYGATSVDGGRGSDTVYYAFPGTVDLTHGTAVGADYSDRVVEIENVAAGGGRHVIIGDGTHNSLIGGGGHDVIRGQAGDDALLGGAGDDLLAGGPGIDQIRGRGGDDVCTEGEDVQGCEQSPLTGSKRLRFPATMPRDATGSRHLKRAPLVY